MKFTLKGLIALFLTSSALFLTPMRSDAQINMKTLAQVAKSCQKDVPSRSYYQPMTLNAYLANEMNSEYFKKLGLSGCIYQRYHYSLVLSKFPWLASAGKIMPGYPGSVVVGKLSEGFPYSYQPRNISDCLIAQDTSSNVCENAFGWIGLGRKYRDSINMADIDDQYIPYVCPSCVIAHDNLSGSNELILKAFIQWFLKLDKPKRREVISFLGDNYKVHQLRISLQDESSAAVREYWNARKRVEQQEQERRRRELLGN
ncbi:hypothetical protein [Nostoc sp.]|uniref:hypothetical protein n=1 Tax=Nostoc sp. TaxID=1180 RepID=UPI003594073A